LPVDPATGEPVISNPLVAAYVDSLGARGFSPDNQGLIITTLNGEVLAEHNADKQFNPASVTKVATSLTVISRLGPDFKFRTTLYTDGALDPATGVLNGSLYVIGSGDPAFFYENAILIADKLNRNGIREVNGNLNVLGQFYLNFSTSREASAKALRIALDPATWNAAARGSYSRFLAMRAAEERMNESMARQNGETYRPAPWPSSPPSLKISGETITSPTVDTTSLKLIAVHTSLPLVRLLKGLNDFSNNWMAHVIGNLVGGPDAVERFLVAEVGFKEDEATFATSSGLGANYISPRSTITILRKLIAYLHSKGLSIGDILPIAGIDAGTLERRFTDAYRGSVVAKTGTLNSVSALAGVAYTRSKGPVLFVLYNRGGSTYRFRAVQDETLKKIITLFGGPAPVRYAPAGSPHVSKQAAEPGTESTSGSDQKH
jgi:D-alanyl-D-alanine carboxypeptidase/D-alanyl-D-alanine-endopeptidase (penicillin-binding protein 4)